jgi:hypothetical protein
MREAVPGEAPLTAGEVASGCDVWPMGVLWGQVGERGTGGAIFAGILLIIGGGVWILEGLAGIVKGTSYLHTHPSVHRVLILGPEWGRAQARRGAVADTAVATEKVS